jgi:hypothetical protein
MLARGQYGDKKLGAGEKYFQLFFVSFSDLCMKWPWLLGMVEVEEK